MQHSYVVVLSLLLSTYPVLSLRRMIVLEAGSQREIKISTYPALKLANDPDFLKIGAKKIHT